MADDTELVAASPQKKGGKKRTKLKKEHREFIAANIEIMTVEEMHQILKVSIYAIRHCVEYMKRHPEHLNKYLKKGSDEAGLVNYRRLELRAHPQWVNLQEQFTEKELHLFEMLYVKYMKQFDNDVLATEETQLFKAIELEIFLNRNKVQQKQSEEDIVATKRALMQELEQPPDNRNTELIQTLHNNINYLRESSSARTKQYGELFTKQQSVLEDLKALRQQRIDKAIRPEVSYVDLIRSLEEEDTAARHAREIELIKLAKKKEEVRLTRPHKYINGEVDIPILNAETVMQKNEEICTEETET